MLERVKMRRYTLSWPSDHIFFYLFFCFFSTSRRTMTAMLIYKQDICRHPRFSCARARAHAKCRCDGSLTEAKWRNVHVGLRRRKRRKICHDGAFPHSSNSIHHLFRGIRGRLSDRFPRKPRDVADKSSFPSEVYFTLLTTLHMLF